MSEPVNTTAGGERLIWRFWQSASGFWLGPGRLRGWVLFFLLIATILLQLVVQYQLNFWNRDFFNAIERKNESELWLQILIFLPLAAASLTLALFSVWCRMTLQRNWREWFSKHLYDLWIGSGRLRKLKYIAGDHQNPEYRIAEDVRLATDLPIDLTLGLFSSCLTAVTFIGILWSVGGALVIHVFSLAVPIPGYLLIASLLYSLLLIALTAAIGRNLAGAILTNKRAEADLRAVGAQLRENGEKWSSLFEQMEARNLIGDALDRVIAGWRALCWQLMRMTLVSHSNNLLTPFIGLLLCTPKYVLGEMNLGEVVQAAAAFGVVQGAFNWFTDSYGRIAEMTSSARRVATLLIALDQIDGAGLSALDAATHEIAVPGVEIRSAE